jgi:phospholipid-binding lipoprotein MlaA
LNGSAKVNIIKLRLFTAAIVMAGVLFAVPHVVSASEQTKKPIQQDVVQLAQADDDDVNDPLEPMNRTIFEFNEFVMSLLFRPVATIYNENLPDGFRSGVSNFLDNLATPVTVANQLLQGDPEGAIISVSRFMVNSTMGIGGLADVATEAGVEGREEDFGQTLGAWGVGEGVYIVLPIFGPSNPRDAVGKFLVDGYFDPVGHWISNTEKDELDWTLTAVDGLDEYAGVVDDLDQVKKTSVDYYAAIRSLYRQKRKSEINNGEQLELPAIPDLGYDLDPEDFNQPLAGTTEARGIAQ